MSEAYRNQSREVLKSGRYIQAVVTGGLNQMRLQIGNAVVIARILGAALVVPVLQENAIWHDRRHGPTVQEGLLASWTSLAYYMYKASTQFLGAV